MFTCLLIIKLFPTDNFCWDTCWDKRWLPSNFFNRASLYQVCSIYIYFSSLIRASCPLKHQGFVGLSSLVSILVMCCFSFFFSFLFYFLRSMVSNGEILQHKASIGHSSNSGRAEDSDLEVCFNFPDSWLPITINMITPLLQLMEIGHMPKLWIPGCQIFAINFFHFEYLCSSYLKKK